jgi:hypothetical protein
MKYLLMGLAALAVAAALPSPASAITCPPGTKLSVVKQKMVCMQTNSKKKMATPKPIPKHT